MARELNLNVEGALETLFRWNKWEKRENGKWKEEGEEWVGIRFLLAKTSLKRNSLLLFRHNYIGAGSDVDFASQLKHNYCYSQLL